MGTETEIWTDVFLVASNVVALWSVRWAYKKTHMLEAYVLLQSALASIVYHLFTATGAPPTAPYTLMSALKRFDFYCAILVLICLSVYAMALRRHRAVPVVALGSVMVFVLQLRPFDAPFEIGVSSVCVLMVGLSYIIRKRLPRCRPKEVLLSLTFIAAALFCFHSEVGPYWVMHSLWHIFIYISTFFVLNIPVMEEIRRVLSWETIHEPNQAELDRIEAEAEGASGNALV
jgi:hypothetical protein